MELDTHFTVQDRRTLTQVETKLDRAIDDIKNLTNNFASKTEFLDLQKEVDEMRRNINKGVWIVLTVVIIAVLSLVIINHNALHL